MKLILFILTFLSFSGFASERCENYEFQGTLRLREKAFFLVINEGTLSEIRIKIPKNEELKFLPYHDELTSGKFENGTFTQLDFAMPDGKEFQTKTGDCR